MLELNIKKEKINNKVVTTAEVVDKPTSFEAPTVLNPKLQLIIKPKTIALIQEYIKSIVHIKAYEESKNKHS